MWSYLRLPPGTNGSAMMYGDCQWARAPSNCTLTSAMCCSICELFPKSIIAPIVRRASAMMRLVPGCCQRQMATLCT